MVLFMITVAITIIYVNVWTQKNCMPQGNQITLFLTLAWNYNTKTILTYWHLVWSNKYEIISMEYVEYNTAIGSNIINKYDLEELSIFYFLYLVVYLIFYILL